MLHINQDKFVSECIFYKFSSGPEVNRCLNHGTNNNSPLTSHSLVTLEECVEKVTLATIRRYLGVPEMSL